MATQGYKRITIYVEMRSPYNKNGNVIKVTQEIRNAILHLPEVKSVSIGKITKYKGD